MLHERSQAEFANAQKSCRDHRVEDARRDETKTSAHQTQIEIGALQDKFLFRKRRGEWRKIKAGERIDQIILAVETQLQQTKFLEIGMQTVRFRIDCDAID